MMNALSTAVVLFKAREITNGTTIFPRKEMEKF
jgi:hypothetical protein